MKIDIKKPTVTLLLGKTQIEMTDAELEQLFEVLRVHLKKGPYYYTYPFYGSTIYTTSTGTSASGIITGTAGSNISLVSGDSND